MRISTYRRESCDSLARRKTRFSRSYPTAEAERVSRRFLLREESATTQESARGKSCLIPA